MNEANELKAKISRELRGIFLECSLENFLRKDVPRVEQILRERLKKAHDVLKENGILLD